MAETTDVDRAAAPWLSNSYLSSGRFAVADAFEEVARQVPDLLAVDDGANRVTYDECVRLTNRVANAVLDRHADTATPVIALCGHGLDPLLITFGIVAAGRLVAPLDARDPADRLRNVIAASGARLVIAEPQFVELARAVADCTVLSLDEALTYPETKPPVEIPADIPGMVVFTSGSTGAPKGVVLGHYSFVGKAMAQAYRGTMLPGDRVVMNTSFGFTVAYSRIFGALMNGATLFTYDPRVRGQRGFAEWAAANGITAANFMAPILRALADSPPTARMEAMRKVTVGGDTVYGSDIARARPLFGPATEFGTNFASTESGVVCSHTITPEDEQSGRAIPLGKVEPWVEVRLLDPDTGAPVPDGQPGQLVVVNPHVAKGYWNDPAATAAAFFAEPDGRRGFRSSDLVRVDPDGVLHHLGRIDSRVKVRGALVATAEVERALVSLDGIAGAAVVGEPLPEGGHRLVAYVVPDAGVTPSVWQLRRELGHRLPTTMVPSAIVSLDALPLNSRGKVDKAVLPPPPAPVTRPYREPKGKERELAELFGEILGIERVGCDDDFFELGGDSLGVVELVAAISERFGVDVVASTVLDTPTVAELAPRLTRRRARHASVVVALGSEGSGMPFFCATGGGAPAMSLLALAEATAVAGGSDAGARPFYGMQPRGLEERALPDHTIAAAARRNLRSIRDVYPVGRYILGGYSFGATVAFEMACQLQARGESLPLLVILDSPAPGMRKVATRANRIKRRRRELEADAPAGGLRRTAVVGTRAARFAARSSLAHAERRWSLTSAGLFPRRGLDQYELFLRLNGHMARDYRPDRSYNGPVLVIRSESPPGGVNALPDLGWSTCTTGAISVVDVPGDHFSMLRRPPVLTLGAKLAEAFAAIS